MLREARIILPCDTGHPKDAEAHAYLADQLLDLFGGFTCKHAEGAWKDPGSGIVVWDHVKVYDVAVDPDGLYVNKLARIAVEAGKMIEQTCVYVRYADGTVELVECGAPPLRFDASLGDMPYLEHRKMPASLAAALDIPVGQKRLPEVGEVWKTDCGDVVAVYEQTSSVLDGALKVVTIGHGTNGSMYHVGSTRLVNLDGKVLRGGDGTHPHDLVKFLGAWVDTQPRCPTPREEGLLNN